MMPDTSGEEFIVQLRAAVKNWTRVLDWCARRLLIGQCSQCPGHSLCDEAGRGGRSLAAGPQRAQGLKLD